MENLLGIYEKALPLDVDWEERLNIAKRLGFDFIEISIDEKDWRLDRLYWSEEKIYELRRAMEATGITIQSMCFSGHRRFPLGSRDPEVRKKALDLMRRAIDFAGKLGIRVIQLAGYDVYYEKHGQDTHEMFIENLVTSVKMAEKKQVMLAIEIMDTEYISSMTRYMAIDGLVNSPWLAVYPDTGNLSAWGNDVFEELEIGIHKVVGMHIKDTLAVTDDCEGKFKDVSFGEGCVDFVGFFQKLKALGYTGPFMMEMWSGENYDDPVAAVAEAKSFVVGQLALGGYV